MELFKSLAVAAVAAITVSPVLARNTPYFLDWSDVMALPEMQGRLGSVQFMFGEKTMPADAERVTADVVVNNISKGERRDDDVVACQRAAQAALTELAKRARDAEANAVVNIVSFYKMNAYTSAKQYECHAGGTGGHLTFKADLVKLRK